MREGTQAYGIRENTCTISRESFYASDNQKYTIFLWIANTSVAYSNSNNNNK